jgi:hypothetical protein
MGLRVRETRKGVDPDRSRGARGVFLENGVADNFIHVDLGMKATSWEERKK